MIKIFRSTVLFYRGRDGEQEEAVKILKEVMTQNPKMIGIRALLAIFLANQGNKIEARTLLTEETRSLAKADHDMAYWMTSANCQLGEIDDAFYWLERAVKLGNENRPWFESDKCLAPMRDDARFAELMNKIEH